jgi:hypothetical protein
MLFCHKFAKNMKANIYYLFLIFVLPLGGTYLFANTHHNAPSSDFSKYGVKHEQVKHKNSNHHSVLSVIIDIDFDEEFHTNENPDEGNSNNLLANTKGFFTNWYLTLSGSYLYKSYSNNFKTFTLFSVNSNPIYLIIGVFRI